MLESLGLDVTDLRQKLDHSRGMSTHLYYDPVAYEVDMKGIFAREWQYIGPTEWVENPGDVIVGYAGQVPVVVTRAADGELHGFINACRHRGYRVVGEKRTNCKRLVCPYHAWSYGLEGHLQRAPGSEEDETFDAGELGLLPVAVERWGQGVYVNADANALPYVDSYRGLDKEANRIGMLLEPGTYTFYRESIHNVSSNWKLWLDNFVECYHCPNIHGESFAAAYATINPAKVETRFHDRFMTNCYERREGKSATSLRADNARTINLFPGQVYIQQDDLMIISQMRPTGPESTQQVTHYFLQEGAALSRVDDWIALWDQTFSEDGAAVAIQQEVVRCGLTEPNRLMPSREEAVFHFNRWIYDSYERYLNGGAK